MLKHCTMTDNIRSIIRGLANTSGELVFQHFVANLAAAVDAEYAFIGRIDADGTSMTTLAYCADGNIQPNTTLSLQDTPCIRVLGGEQLMIADAVADQFPSHPLLQKMAIRGYGGIAVRDSQNRAIGILCCLFRQPVADPEGTLDLINLFASRIGAEIERRESVTALALLNQQLEQKVEERTLQLTQLNAELDAFCHSISHDLRAPLRAINGFSQALQEDYGGQLDEGAHQYLQRIRANTRTMGKLLTDLLSLSNLTSQPLQPVRFNLVDMLPALIAEQRERFPQLAVQVHMLPQLMVTGDRSMLKTLMSNLLANAFSYARADANLELELGLLEQGGQKEIFLRDNGSGIPATRLADAFNPFARFHNNPQIQGNGIGLATCKRIVSKHQGQIRIAPNPGHGITVHFTLEGFTGLPN